MVIRPKESRTLYTLEEAQRVVDHCNSGADGKFEYEIIHIHDDDRVAVQITKANSLHPLRFL